MMIILLSRIDVKRNISMSQFWIFELRLLSYEKPEDLKVSNDVRIR